MFSRLREHFGTAGLIVAIVALVAALAGGAIAATGGSGGGKATASAKAKQGKQGKPGKTGPAGPAGPTGPAGPQGPAGADGKNGDNGAPGSSVTSATEPKGANCSEGGSKFTAGAATTYACNGKNGKTGEDGANGADGADGLPGAQGPPGPTCDPSGECLLPPGATETGLWSASTPKGVLQLWTSISFPLRLSAAPAEHFVTFEQANNGEVPECPGSADIPKAEPGSLCLYEAALTNLEPPFADSSGDFLSGLSMKFTLLDEEKPARTNGAWAVTACPQGGCLP